MVDNNENIPNENVPTGFARLLDRADRLVHSRFFGLLRDLEPAFIVVTVIGVGFAGFGLWSDFVDRERQRTARAWQTVASELPGNTGKVEAAEYLASEGHSLSRTDFSPNSVRDGDRIAPACEYRVYLPALDLREAVANGAYLSCTDMDTDEEGKHPGKHAQFDTARLSRAKFIRSNAEGVSFADAVLTSADFRAAQLGGADFSGATLNAARFECANLQNVVFDDKTKAEGASVDYADMRGVRGMSCETLKRMEGWENSCQQICEESVREPDHCGPKALDGPCSAAHSDEQSATSPSQSVKCNVLDIRREITFRLDQVDRVVDGRFSIEGGTNRCDLIHVVAKLGGIAQRPPPKEDETVWIGGSGYGYRHIPFKTGSRSDEFGSDSLPDLVEDYMQCPRSTGEASEKSKRTELLRSIKDFEDASVSVEGERKCTDPWIQSATDAWEKVAKTARSIVEVE